MRLPALFLTLLMATPLLGQLKGNAQKGRELYLEKCALCHGSQGEGWDWSKKAQPPIPVPDLAKAAPKQSDQYLFDIIKGGGEAVGKTRLMPPFGFDLSDQEVWDIVTHLRMLGGKTK
ncbi:MAG: cytochrome c [Deltaproteobacteria bacterium]|nr:cytochrome c [Deltaproteobacteria bacterium]